MLDNDTTRLDFLDLNVLPRHLLVHHATTALHPSVHQFTYLQATHLSTLKMNVMLEMPSVLLTIIRLDMTGASCRWSGLRVNVAGTVMALNL